MNISVGSDHRGVEYRKIIRDIVESLGHTVLDCGTMTTESCDYPDIAQTVGNSIRNGESQFGILILSLIHISEPTRPY